MTGVFRTVSVEWDVVLVWFRGLTPQQQPGSYQGGEMMMKSVFWWRKPEHPEETTDLRLCLVSWESISYGEILIVVCDGWRVRLPRRGELTEASSSPFQLISYEHHSNQL